MNFGIQTKRVGISIPGITGWEGIFHLLPHPVQLPHQLAQVPVLRVQALVLQQRHPLARQQRLLDEIRKIWHQHILTI